MNTEKVSWIEIPQFCTHKQTHACTHTHTSQHSFLHQNLLLLSLLLGRALSSPHLCTRLTLIHSLRFTSGIFSLDTTVPQTHPSLPSSLCCHIFCGCVSLCAYHTSKQPLSWVRLHVQHSWLKLTTPWALNFLKQGLGLHISALLNSSKGLFQHTVGAQ